jgi:hypothetical protein
MKYAICLRGISYHENYQHNSNIPPFKIDFHDTIHNFETYLVNPLKLKGNDVDIYFSTYPSVYLIDYYLHFLPKKVKLRKYQEVPVGTPSSVYNGVLDSLEMIIKSGIEYDYIIITRFDLIFLKNMAEIYFAENAISVMTPGDDNFIVLSGNLAELFYDHYKWLLSMGKCNHEFSHEFFRKGHRVHLVHGQTAPIRSILMPSRDIFISKDHPYYRCNYEELFDTRSSFYIKPGSTKEQYFQIQDL